MLKEAILRAPFFEIGPKSYLYGEELLELARVADRAAAKYGVQLLFTAPLTMLARIAAETEHLLVLAPHMDALEPGRGIAKVLPEAVKAAGARGVMLNHAECPMIFSELEQSVKRAGALGLMTVVCASSIAEIKAVALLAPDVIVAEPTELIGSGQTGDDAYIHASMEAVHSVNPDILVLLGAGIKDGSDVGHVIACGADGTGSSSAVVKAPDRAALIDEMLAALKAAHENKKQ